MREALRFGPVAVTLRRRTFAAKAPADPAHAGSQAKRAHRATAAANHAVTLSLASAMRDGRRIARPDIFDPMRDPCAHLHFGRGPHACLAQARFVGTIPAMPALLMVRGALECARSMPGMGLCPRELTARFWI